MNTQEWNAQEHKHIKFYIVQNHELLSIISNYKQSTILTLALFVNKLHIHIYIYIYIHVIWY